jgi:S-adenosylmethionine hydrolase
MRPFISFMTDFGPDSAAAVCRGVMLSIAPEARINDISHSVRKYAIRDGAFLLSASLPWMPVGVHVAVVDPGVGTPRRPVALLAGRGDVLIGPDNGLLIPAGEALGGIAEARSIDNRDLMLPVISSSFHGRDIFSPVAAHLAMGVPYESVGPGVPVDRLVRLPEQKPTIRNGALETVIDGVMIFGNVTFAGVPADLEKAIGKLEPGRPLVLEFGGPSGRPNTRERTTWAETFGRVPVGQSLVMADSQGNLSFADNQGNAAGRLGLSVDQAVRILPG